METEQEKNVPELRTSFETGTEPTAEPGDGTFHFGSGGYDTQPDPVVRRYAFRRTGHPASGQAVQPDPVPAAVPKPIAAPSEPAPAAPPAVNSGHGGALPGAGNPASRESSASRIPSSWQQFRAVTPPPPAEPGKPRPRTRRRQPSAAWITAAVVLALVFGLFLGILVSRVLSEPARRAAAPSESCAPASSASPSGKGEGRNEPAEIYRKNVQSVVGIEVLSADGNRRTGTGFLISERGYLLTNDHVVRGASAVNVTLSDGTRCPAVLVSEDNLGCDVALLKIEAEGLKPVTLGDSDKISVGDPVCTIGNPLGELANSLSVGYLSARDRVISGDTAVPMLQTDAAINSGSSGGPLFNFSGEVIGIVTTKYSGESSSGVSVEGLGFAVPINAVASTVKALMQ